MRSSTPQLNVEHYRPENYYPRAHYGIAIPRIAYRSAKNLIAPIGLGCGIFAILGSWVPYLNFLFLAFAILGIVMSAIGFVHPQKTKLNKKESLLGLALNGAAIIIFFLSYMVLYFVSSAENSYSVDRQPQVNAYTKPIEHGRDNATVVIAPGAPVSVLEGTEDAATETPLGVKKGYDEEDTRVVDNPFGRKIAVNGLEVVVNGVEEKNMVSSLSGPPKFARHGGKFSVVDITLINIANAPYTFFRPDDFFVLTTCETLNGDCPQYYEYEESIGAIDDYAFGRRLSPRLEAHAKLIYEIPDSSNALWLGVANLKQELANKQQSPETYKGAYLLKLK